MKADQKRIAIAECCGWIPDDDGDGSGWEGSWTIGKTKLFGKLASYDENGKIKSYLCDQCVPDYLKDLNAMRVAEGFLDTEKFERADYLSILSPTMDLWEIANASPEKKADAFLLAKKIIK